MNEEFVSFSLAKKLKEKGYPQTPDNMSCMPYYEYDEVGNHAALCNEIVYYQAESRTIFAAPAIHKVLKWLREEKKIFIQMGLVEYKWEYMCFDINTIADNFYGWHKAMLKGDKVRFFESYEQAALAGIEYCLDNLI